MTDRTLEAENPSDPTEIGGVTADVARIDPETHRGHLAHALRHARKSHCPKMQYGCVVTSADGQEVLGVGRNWSVRPECYRECPRLGVPSGTLLERCYAVHAEHTAVLAALDISWPAEPKIAYVAGLHPDGRPWRSSGFSCSFCARIMRAAGVIAVVVPTGSAPGYTVLTMDEVIDSSFAVAFGEREA